MCGNTLLLLRIFKVHVHVPLLWMSNLRSLIRNWPRSNRDSAILSLALASAASVACKLQNNMVQNFLTDIFVRQKTFHDKQECIPVGCVPPASWPYPVVSNGGCLPNPPSPRQNPLLPEADPPRTEGMTHACENITLPQTLFAGGKKYNNLKCTKQIYLPQSTFSMDIPLTAVRRFVVPYQSHFLLLNFCSRTTIW